MILEKFKKQPSEDKDYDVSYEPWLSPMGDELDDVETIVLCLDDELDTSLEVYNYVLTPNAVKLWVRGGTAGYVYKVTLKANTVGLRIDESELIFIVVDY